MDERDVGLDAALGVAQLGIDGLARRAGKIIRGNVLERCERALAGDLELGEGRLVDQCRALADGAVFF